MGSETLAERQPRRKVLSMSPPNPAWNSVQGQRSSYRGISAPTSLPFIPARQPEGPTETQASKGSPLSSEVHKGCHTPALPSGSCHHPSSRALPHRASQAPRRTLGFWSSSQSFSTRASAGLPQPSLILPAAQAF